MKKTLFLVVLLLISCQQGTKQQSTKEQGTPSEDEQQVSIKKEPVDTLEVHQKPTTFNSVLRPNELVVFNKIYLDTIVFRDYDDDFDYWYLVGKKNDVAVSFVYNWDWGNNEQYNFKQGDRIAVQWQLDSITNPGDEEVVTIVERAVDAKKIASSKQPIQFLKRVEAYDESVQATVSQMVLNQSFLANMSLQEKAALAYTAFDIGNECEYGYDSEGNGRVLWCRIPTALNLEHQCSDKQLTFLKSWFAKDTLALKKLQRCPSMPNTATVQTTFDEILIETEESENRITVQYTVTGMNMRESTSQQWNKTDVFEYDTEHIRLVDSKKTELNQEEANMNPDAAENIDPQKFVIALKDYILNQWKKQDQFNSLGITFSNNVLNVKDENGFTLSNYDFNEMIINGTEDPQVLYLTIANEGGGGGGNVVLEETYILKVIDAQNFEIRSEETKLTE